MKKILFSIYTGEYPNQFAGGPNNIIYKLIKHPVNNKFTCDYFSNDLFIENLKRNKLLDLHNQLSFKKKTASFLFQNTDFYKRIFTNDYYLPYHFRKKEKRFRAFNLTKKKYDLIHSHDSLSLALISNRDEVAKKIVTIHSKGPLSDEIKNMAKGQELKNKIEIKLKQVERESLKLADVITFPSRAAQSYFEESMELSLEKKNVKIIYNGIDNNYINSIEKDLGVFSKYGIDTKNKIVIINVASHAPEKNINIIIDVVELIVKKYKQNIQLINVGQKAVHSDYEKKVENLNLNDHIIFLDKIPNNDVLKLIKGSDIFLMTSEKVIFDLVVLEALACGACCVVSNEGGNKEIIQNGDNGYLIDIKNIEEIAKRIISVDKNKVSENAIETSRKYSVDKMAKEYFELYENVLNGKQ